MGMKNEKGVCNVCGAGDFTAAGKCKACSKKYNKAYRAKHAGGGSVKTAKAAKPQKPEALRLSLPAAYGLSASIDEDYLQIQQTDQEGNTDSLMISRAEFIALVGRFSQWANEEGSHA
jgi:predicted ATP-dependent serine protease